MIALDHLVIGTDSLDAGGSALHALLAARTEPGGRHDGFGTHNRLLSLGPDAYLELIAPDPEQPAPSRPRPFGLDEPSIAARVAARPRLLAWVLRTDDIAATRRLLGLPDGPAVPMRRGQLAWRISLPTPAQPAGTPILIDWGDTPTPSTTLPDRGLRLVELAVSVPQQTAQRLAPLADDPRIRFMAADAVSLAATFETPRGPVTLD